MAFYDGYTQHIMRFFSKSRTSSLSYWCSQMWTLPVSARILFKHYAAHPGVSDRRGLRRGATLLLLHYSGSWAQIFAELNHYMAKYESGKMWDHVITEGVGEKWRGGLQREGWQVNSPKFKQIFSPFMQPPPVNGIRLVFSFSFQQPDLFTVLVNIAATARL